MSVNYPGLNLHRFLMEIKDITAKKQPGFSADLDQNLETISTNVIEEMTHAFTQGVPFAYLLENSEFYHNHFYVNSDVLIPRPETEFLVDMIAREFKNKKAKVLDVGTGSGVILLSLLAHGVGSSGVGVDISEKALQVARINASRLGLEKKVNFVLSDRLSLVEGTYDLIVSNPPYIKASSHKNLVQKSVDEFEPHLALYLPDDFYVFWFEDFFAQIRSHLKGTFYMEGHELEVEEQALMLGRLGFQNVQVLPDMAGSKRYLKAQFL